MDGTYHVSAQAFDTRGVPGEARSVTVHVNRRIPYAPTSVKLGTQRRSTAESSISTGAATWSATSSATASGASACWVRARRSARTAGSTTRSRRAAPTRTPTASCCRSGCPTTSSSRWTAPTSRRPRARSATATRRAASCPPSRRARTRRSPTRRRSSTACRVRHVDRAVGRHGVGPASDPLLPHLPRRRHEPRRPLRRDRRRQHDLDRPQPRQLDRAQVLGDRRRRPQQRVQPVRTR